MTDPYKVLGISPQATDEEIKTAYRDLARKYHPDNYQDNPLADLANDKMQEINDAYDQIMLQRKGGNSPGAAGSGFQRQSRPAGGAGQFADIRRMLNNRRITEAEELLDGVPKAMQDAEWHFLKGSIQYTRGWLDEAYNNFVTACNMDPGNGEYRTALNQLQWQRQTGRTPGVGYHTTGQPYGGGCSVCDICATLYCANCCCNCMGCR